MRTALRVLMLLLLLPLLPVVAAAQPEGAASAPDESAKPPLIAHNEHVYRGVSMILRGAAELMPEAEYGFKPTEAVRSFGEIVAHVADSQYAFCSIVLGDEGPTPDLEGPTASKADLMAALEEAFAYCRRAYDGLDETAASEMVQFQGRPTPRLAVLYVNQIHSIEHYGNLVTYLRMNDIVPPTSDPEVMKRLMKR